MVVGIRFWHLMARQANLPSMRSIRLLFLDSPTVCWTMVLSECLCERIAPKLVIYSNGCRYRGFLHCRVMSESVDALALRVTVDRTSQSREIPSSVHVDVANRYSKVRMCTVESEPVEASSTLWDGFPSIIDETVSQILA